MSVISNLSAISTILASKCDFVPSKIKSTYPGDLYSAKYWIRFMNTWVVIVPFGVMNTLKDAGFKFCAFFHAIAGCSTRNNSSHFRPINSETLSVLSLFAKQYVCTFLIILPNMGSAHTWPHCSCPDTEHLTKTLKLDFFLQNNFFRKVKYVILTTNKGILLIKKISRI